MRLTYVGGRYISESTFQEREIPKVARFRWDPGAKQWWTDDPERAMTLAQYADAPAAEALRAHVAGKAERLEASRATDAEIDVPAPEGLEYRAFQRAGIAFCLRAFGDLDAS